MDELQGKTAFVTGGASGIGFALCRAFAQSGMKVMLADIEIAAMDRAVGSLRDFGSNVRGIQCDVAASSGRQGLRSRPSARSISSATMPASPPAAASIISRSTIGVGSSTSI